MAIITTDNPVTINTSQPIFIRYAKSWSQLCIKYHARGDAINSAIAISFTKSFDNKLMILVTDAPNTFLIPISLVRFTAARVAKPNKPRHARKIEIPPAHPTIALHRCSDL